LQLTSYPNLCISQRQHIWQLQNDCFDTWSIQSSMAFIFAETWTPNSLHIMMLIGQVIVTIESPLQHTYVLLVLILFLRAKKNNELWHGRPLRLNIAPLPLLPLKRYDF
jgi:hypothetical protein